MSKQTPTPFPKVIVVERDVSLAATSGTTVGISVPANTIVLAAGFENYTTVPNVTAYTMNITDGTTTFASALNYNNTAARTVRGGFTGGIIPAADTIDVVTTITGSPGVIAGRVWALIADISDQDRAPGSADRDTLS